MAYLQQVIYFDKAGAMHEPLGSLNQVIFNDLKTLKGVLNRINKYKINSDKSYIIYQYNDLIQDFFRNTQKTVYKHII